MLKTAKNRKVNYGVISSAKPADSSALKPNPSLAPTALPTPNLSTSANSKLAFFDELLDEKDDRLRSPKPADVEETFFKSGRDIKTNSDKFITVSKAALKRGVGVMGDFTNSPLESRAKKPNKNRKSAKFSAPRPARPNRSLSGFSTGRGEAVSISEEALKASQSGEPVEQATSFSGFSTGAGASVKISPEALEKTKSSGFASQGFPGFSTGSGAAVKISAEALEKTKSSANQPIASSGPKGFSTGLGKKVNISESALKQARVNYEFAMRRLL